MLNEMEEDWSPKQFLLKGLHTNLLELTLPEVHLWDSSLKGARDIQELGDAVVWHQDESWRGRFLRSVVRGHCSFAEPLPPPQLAGRHHI